MEIEGAPTYQGSFIYTSTLPNIVLQTFEIPLQSAPISLRGVFTNLNLANLVPDTPARCTAILKEHPDDLKANLVIAVYPVKEQPNKIIGRYG